MSHALFDSQQQRWKAKHQTCLEGMFPQVKCPDQVYSSFLIASFGHGSNNGANLDKSGVVLDFKRLMMIFFCRTNLKKEEVRRWWEKRLQSCYLFFQSDMYFLEHERWMDETIFYINTQMPRVYLLHVFDLFIISSTNIDKEGIFYYIDLSQIASAESEVT